MGEGLLAASSPQSSPRRASRPPASPGRSRVAADDVSSSVCLDTLEYLKKGGRISGPQAAIGTLLVGQADHRDQGRRGRHCGSRADPGEGARACDRAHHDRPDRTAVRAPHGQPGRRGVPRPSSISRSGRDRSVHGVGRPGRPVGRAAPRPRRRRGGGPLRKRHGAASRAERPHGRSCATVPQRWRNRTATNLEAGGYTPDDIRTVRRAPPDRARRVAPWGRPGDDPRYRPMPIRAADTEEPLTHDDRAGRCADQPVGGRPAAVRSGRRAAQPRPRPAPGPPRAAARAHRPLPGQDGRRHASRSSPATASSTTSAAARPRAASATTRTSPSTRSRRWRCG